MYIQFLLFVFNVKHIVNVVMQNELWAGSCEGSRSKELNEGDDDSARVGRAKEAHGGDARDRARG